MSGVNPIGRILRQAQGNLLEPTFWLALQEAMADFEKRAGAGASVHVTRSYVPRNPFRKIVLTWVDWPSLDVRSHNPNGVLVDVYHNEDVYPKITILPSMGALVSLWRYGRKVPLDPGGAGWSTWLAWLESVQAAGLTFMTKRVKRNLVYGALELVEAPAAGFYPVVYHMLSQIGFPLEGDGVPPEYKGGRPPQMVARAIAAIEKHFEIAFLPHKVQGVPWLAGQTWNLMWILREAPQGVLYKRRRVTL